MTLSEIANEYHVTPQAIRNRLQRAGYTLQDVREIGSNQISANGEAIIKDLFTQAPAARRSGKKKTEGNTTRSSSTGGSGSTLATIRAECDELRIKTATAEAIAAERQRTIELLQEQIRVKDEQIANLTKAAALPKLMEPQQQEPAPAEPPRRGLFSWLRKGEKVKK